jgi:hypothetical protein
MAIFMVGYDPVGSNDYTRIEEGIEQFPAWGRVLTSQWLVEFTGAAHEAAAYLERYIDPDDRLLVIEVTNNGAWERLILPDDVTREWMAKARR